jgi:tRNA/tmRNA/rRNA uracil-C5-methylase (TrmA/RlmC/RlmD family)
MQFAPDTADAYHGIDMNDSPILQFEKIVSEGKAMAHWHEKAVFAVGPLPGETARMRVTREKPTWAEAVVREFVETSVHRRQARETHFMSCSPWQGVDYDYQLKLKREMLAELFGRPGLELPVAEIVGSKQQFGYRNKLEFALRPGADGGVELAMHERGSVDGLVATPEGCALGSAAMNEVARAVQTVLSSLEVAGVAEKLTVRQSSATGAVVAVVTLARRLKRDWSRLEVPEAAGVAAVYRARGGFERLWSWGELELSESLGGVELRYPWEAFFQVNVPVFAQALGRILARIVPDTRVVDLYGGVGTIGLPAARTALEVVGIEVSQAAVDLADRNAGRNGLVNYRAVAAPSESVSAELLARADTVVVDPPRAGLHSRVVEQLLAAGPRQIVYLSCNPVTQVRDLMRLMPEYSPAPAVGFDFYPGTLHVESLVVLSRSTMTA